MQSYKLHIIDFIKHFSTSCFQEFIFVFTSLFRAGPAKIAKISVIPMATQRCISTWEGMLLLVVSLFHRTAYVSMVRNIPIRDKEQPMEDISSNACFSAPLTLEKQN
jgi:hypothetical protein